MKVPLIFFRFLLTTLLSISLFACATQPQIQPVKNSPPPDGFYRVQRGDNLFRIGLRFNRSMDTLAEWNHLTDVNQLEVGQLLRIAPAVTQTKLNKPESVGNISDALVKTTALPLSPSSAALKNLDLVWPASGKIIANFDGATRKGIDIGGVVGTPVVAVSSGEVVYAADKLRSYGKLILIRHTPQVLSAYAHNSRILVQVGQKVRQGQKIAEMGTSENGKAALHFELRVNSRAINPTPYLPVR